MTKGTALPLLLLFFGLILWLWGIDYPYAGLYSTNNNYLALASQNYLRFDLVTLKFLPTYAATEQFPGPQAYYLHHPILVFVLSILPFWMFDFDNWVVHVVPLLFNLGSIVMIYKIGNLLWGKRVGLWAAILAVYFPMMSFFWKLIFFEQSTLFFDLAGLYWMLRYLKESRSLYLLYIFLFALLASFSDWAAAYLWLPTLLLLFTRFRMRAVRILLWYSVALGIGFGTFFAVIYIATGSFSDFLAAGWGRAVHNEFLAVSGWWWKIGVIILLRIALYFTPISIIFLFHAVKLMFTGWKRLSIPTIALIYLSFLGFSNLFLFPTASWGYSYFLYYLTPLFAIVGARTLTASRSPSMAAIFILTIFISSVTIHYAKIRQWEKHLWKEEAAKEISLYLAPYEPVGILNFPGDLLENAYLHPTIHITDAHIDDWKDESKNLPFTKIVYACSEVCTRGEREFVDAMSKHASSIELKANDTSAFLLSQDDLPGTSPLVLRGRWVSLNKKSYWDETIELVYREMRNIFRVGQI